jgi:hypothetical protein
LQVSTSFAADQLYTSTTDNLVLRANTDGSSREIFSFPQTGEQRISVDTLNNKLYWLQKTPCRIMRSDPDGTNIEVVFTDTTSGCRFFDLDIDSANGHIYYAAEYGTFNAQIKRADLDGSNQVLIRQSTGGSDFYSIVGLSVDSTNGYIFFGADGGFVNRGFSRMALDGSDYTLIRSTSGFTLVLDIIADPATQHIYMSINANVNSFIEGRVLRAEYDGANTTDLTASGLTQARGLALDSARSRICYLQSSNIFQTTTTNQIVCRSTPGNPSFFQSYTLEAGSSANGFRRPGSLAYHSGTNQLYWGYYLPGGEGPKRPIDALDTQSPSVTYSVLIPQVQHPSGIAIDYPSGSVFIADQERDVIRKLDFDGSNGTDVVTGLNTPEGLSIDYVANKIYWTDSGSAKIQRANLNGSSVQDVVTGLTTPNDLVVDPFLGKLFWIDEGTAKLQSANSDGTDVDDLLVSLDDPQGVTINPLTETLYLGETAFAQVTARSYTGTFESLLTGSFKSTGLTLDPDLSQLFWSENVPRTSRFDLPGVDNRVTVFSSTTSRYIALAKDFSGQIELFGNSNRIQNNDTTPASSDHTDFGSVVLNSAAATATFTIRNHGYGALSLSGTPRVQVTGAASGDFSVTTQPSASLTPGATTTFVVEFSPTARGTRDATLTITSDDSSDSSFSFSISGLGLAPEMVVSTTASITNGDTTPDAADLTYFGSINPASGSATNTFTIENNGNHPLTLSGTPRVSIGGANPGDFTVTTQPATSIAASGTSTFQIRFDPTTGGTRTATVSITNNDPDNDPYTFAISGDGNAPVIGLSGNSRAIANGDITPSAIDHTDFGSANTFGGASVSRTYRVRNSGFQNLVVSTPTFSGTHSAEFSVSPSAGATITPGNFSDYTVTFAPTAAGLRNATFSITSNDTDRTPYTFSVAGTGTEPDIQLSGNSLTIVNGDATPSAADFTEFGSVNANGGSLSRSFTIANTGNFALSLTGTPRVAISGTDAAAFSVTTQPSTPVAASGTTTFSVLFSPTSVGLKSAVVTIQNNDPDEAPFSFAIQGTGILPELKVYSSLGPEIANMSSPPTTTNGTDFEGTPFASGTVDRVFSIHNTGTDVLNISGTPRVTISGAHAADFSLQAAPTAMIATGSSSNFTVRFDPSAAGTRTATLTITSNDPARSPFSFAIQGSGQAPTLALTGLGGNAIAHNDSSPQTADGTDFAEADLGTGMPSATFSIANTGDSTLTLTGPTPVTITGIHASDFSVTTQPGLSVGVSGSTTFAVQFNPSAAGLRSATIQIASDDPTTPSYAFAVQGTGVESEIELTGNSVAISDGDTTASLSDHTEFGEVNITSATIIRSYTITNSGTGPLTISDVSISGPQAANFSITTSPAATVAPSATTTLALTFDPTVPGAHAAVVSIQSNDGNESPYSFAIAGTGIAQAISVTGTGGATIASGDTTPATADGTDFGSATATVATVPVTFTIINPGTDTLALSGTPRVSISGAHSADFSVTTQPTASVSASGSTTFVVAFSPTDLGVRTATISIANDSPTTPTYSFAIQGTGIASQIEVSGLGQVIINGSAAPSAADDTDFGTLSTTSQTVAHTFTITNTGTDTLTLSSITIIGAAAADFTIASPPSLNIGVGGTTSFTVEFDPSTPGLRSAGISISSNSWTESAFSYQIQGTGTEPLLSLIGNSTTISSGSTTPNTADHTDFTAVDVVGGSITRTFTVANLGTEALTISSVQILGLNSADFTITQSPATSIAVSGSSSLEISFDPSARGARTAEIEISSSDVLNPSYTFAIGGSGISPTVELRGNSNTIANNDLAPSIVDGTLFPTTSVISGSADQTFEIANLGDDTLHLTGSPVVAISGANAGDFTVTNLPAASIASGGSAESFVIQFDPQGFGVRTALVTIANDDPDSTPFTFAIQGTGDTAADQDGDGSSDLQESVDGSDPEDFGSVLLRSGDSVCTHWNGFLSEFSQIFELRNSSSNAIDLEVVLYLNDGSQSTPASIRLNAGQQRDLILNDLPGFVTNSLGLVCANIINGPSDSLNGSLSIYRFTGTSYRIGYSLPDQIPWRGARFSSFNTNTPQFAGRPAGEFVANWIEITNTEITAQSGTLRFYDDEGTLVQSDRLTLNGRERRDISAHFLGESKTGLIAWIPDDLQAKFLIRQSRYYLDSAGRSGSLSGLWAATSLSFASGTGRPLSAAFDTRDTVAVVELANTSAQPISIQFRSRDAIGNSTARQVPTFTLAPFASRHVVLNELLSNNLGSVKVDSDRPTSLIATLVEYPLDDERVLRSVAASPLVESFNREKTASYNSYLGQQCMVRIHNSDSTTTTAELTATRWDGTKILDQEPLMLPPFATTEFDICSVETMEAYGEVRLESPSGTALVGAMVRHNSNRSATLVQGL